MKNLILAFYLLIVGCGINSKQPEFNTEIICPKTSYRILILETTAFQVEKAILDSIEYQKKLNKNSKYTVLYLSNNRSTSIYNTTPQELLYECNLIQRPRNPIY
ncbi:MAG: biotin-(acetyl-CoA carboxylase) ligase [Rickettsiales bacterium]|jgi:biotin-(acetyl-CoA carboxylase) ligase